MSSIAHHHHHHHHQPPATATPTTGATTTKPTPASLLKFPSQPKTQGAVVDGSRDRRRRSYEFRVHSYFWRVKRDATPTPLVRSSDKNRVDIRPSNRQDRLGFFHGRHLRRRSRLSSMFSVLFEHGADRASLSETFQVL